MKICFDLDGTLADLYGVTDWLNLLRAESVKPYAEAQTLIRMASLARALHKAQNNGYKVCVISWLSKESTAEYDKAVAETKQAWLKKHLPSVKWDEIHIVKYGTPKKQFADSPEDILFDDEEPNRLTWTGKAYKPEEILAVLKSL